MINYLLFSKLNTSYYCVSYIDLSALVFFLHFCSLFVLFFSFIIHFFHIQGVMNLFERFDRMYELGPEFIDITWGAGGSTSDLTLELCHQAQRLCGLTSCMHLTCTNMSSDKINEAMIQAHKLGIVNILALRGDPPHGESEWKAVTTGFTHAIDLVRYLRAHYDHDLCIGVAGYHEGHL